MVTLNFEGDFPTYSSAKGQAPF